MRIKTEQPEKVQPGAAKVDHKAEEGKQNFQTAKADAIGNAGSGRRRFAQDIAEHQYQRRPSGAPGEVPEQSQGQDMTGQRGTENIK